MLARLLRWFRERRRRKAASDNAKAIPDGAILLTGGVDYRFELVGYQAPLEAIYRAHRTVGGECHVIAALVTERGNSYNAHAVSVAIGGQKVAEFPRGDGRKYAGIIADVAKQGVVVCRASVRAPSDEGDGQGLFRVFLDLASPGKAAPP